jgi:hypothetical protein
MTCCETTGGPVCRVAARGGVNRLAASGALGGRSTSPMSVIAVGHHLAVLRAGQEGGSKAGPSETGLRRQPQPR